MKISSGKLPKIAVLGGTGDQGGGLALRWSLAGYQVTLGSRSVERASALAGSGTPSPSNARRNRHTGSIAVTAIALLFA